MDDPTLSCVYLYRSATSATIRYVGRGATPERAVSHTSGSHNPDLAGLIEAGDFQLEIAGPYDSPEVAAQVEAALISALGLESKQAALVNKTSGDGPRFTPFGVPARYAHRNAQPPLPLSDLGRVTGGALVVRNAFGADLEEGRPRLSAFGQSQDEIVVDNLVRYWLLEPVAEQWRRDPGSKPHVVVGAAGPVKHRYVPGALRIARDRLGEDHPAEEIAVQKPDDLDAFDLRGRLLDGVRFKHFKQYHFIWVDGEGQVRYPD